MTKITSAVAYMHEKRILHRDLKAENVFLNKSGDPKLGDFGISKEITHTLDQAQTCVGTPCYLSPELCQDIPYNAKSDIWALGCLLFEMTALAPAFDAANLISLFYKIIKCNYGALPENTSERIKVLVGDILQSEPEKRPTAKQIFNHPSLSEYNEQVSQVLKAAGHSLQISSVKSKSISASKQPLKLNGMKLHKNKMDIQPSSMDFSTRDTQDTLTDSINGIMHTQTLTNNNAVPKIIQNNQENIEIAKLQLHELPKRSNSVFETPRNANIVHASLNLNKRSNLDELDRPQTCPHSAVSRINDDEEDKIWSKHDDQKINIYSCNRKVSTSSEECSSENEFESAIETSRSYIVDDYSDESFSSIESNEEIAEDLYCDNKINNEDEIPEMICNTDSGEDVGNDISKNPVDGAKLLPGSAWLRTKRAQVMMRRQDSEDQNNNEKTENSKRKHRLAGSSWLSQEERRKRNNEIVLGENNKGTITERKPTKIRNLPGSAWLSKSKSLESDYSISKSMGKHKGDSVNIESLSRSGSEKNSPEKKLSTYSSSFENEVEYPDDFEEYEDDFETDESDEEEVKVRPPLQKSSSIDTVRQSCKELVGSEVFSEICTMLKQGSTVSQISKKYKSKIDKETLETLSLLQN